MGNIERGLVKEVKRARDWGKKVRRKNGREEQEKRERES